MGTKLERKSEGNNSDIVTKADVSRDVTSRERTCETTCEGEIEKTPGCGSALANMWMKENKKRQIVWLKDNNIVF